MADNWKGNAYPPPPVQGYPPPGYPPPGYNQQAYGYPPPQGKKDHFE